MMLTGTCLLLNILLNIYINLYVYASLDIYAYTYKNTHVYIFLGLKTVYTSQCTLLSSIDILVYEQVDIHIYVIKYMCGDTSVPAHTYIQSVSV